MDPMDPETIRLAPKVVLHDHLDGGLRPATVIALADEVGYDATVGTLASTSRPSSTRSV